MSGIESPVAGIVPPLPLLGLPWWVVRAAEGAPQTRRVVTGEILSFQQFVGVAHGNSQIRAAKSVQDREVDANHFAFAIK